MIVCDLSVPVIDGTDGYGEPGCLPVSPQDVGSLEADGWRSHGLSLRVLYGTTYVETSAHLLPDGEALEDLSPDRFLTCAHVVNVDSDGTRLLAPPDQPEGVLPGQPPLLPGLAGMDTFPWASHCRGDVPSFDDPSERTMPFLHRYFPRGGVVVCPPMGLRKLPWERVTLSVAPLKPSGANAAPCRVLAW